VTAEETDTLEQLLATLRQAGWTVALHTDSRHNGALRTDWMFTHTSGRYVRGEGQTDREAVREVLERVRREECR